MDDDVVEVWHLDLSVTDDADRGLLSPDEIARLDRYLVADKKVQFAAARAARRRGHREA